MVESCIEHIIQLDKNFILKTRILTIKLLFLHKKTPKTTPKLKSAIETFFGGIKITIFFNLFETLTKAITVKTVNDPPESPYFFSKLKLHLF